MLSAFMRGDLVAVIPTVSNADYVAMHFAGASIHMVSDADDEYISLYTPGGLVSNGHCASRFMLVYRPIQPNEMDYSTPQSVRSGVQRLIEQGGPFDLQQIRPRGEPMSVETSVRESPGLQVNDVVTVIHNADNLVYCQGMQNNLELDRLYVVVDNDSFTNNPIIYLHNRIGEGSTPDGHFSSRFELVHRPPAGPRLEANERAALINRTERLRRAGLNPAPRPPASFPAAVDLSRNSMIPTPATPLSLRDEVRQMLASGSVMVDTETLKTVLNNAVMYDANPEVVMSGKSPVLLGSQVLIQTIFEELAAGRTVSSIAGSRGVRSVQITRMLEHMAKEFFQKIE